MNVTLPPLHVGQGTTLGALTVFPVWVEDEPLHGLEWRIAALRVSERAGSPVVEELVARNRSTRPLVALEGDLVTGGWQDRMLAKSVVLEPREARVLDALCVEHGRWSGEQAHNVGGRRAAAGIRHHNLAAKRNPNGNAQSEVWNRIARYDANLGGSETSALSAHLDRTRDDAQRLPRPIAGQRGVILGVGGRVLGAELFGNARGLADRWTGILEAALLDARLAPTRPTQAETARGFARWMAAMTLVSGPKAGAADTLTSSRGHVTATGLARESIVHLSLLDERHPVLEVVA